MNCIACGHPEADHGPASGRWQNKETGEWDVVIPGRLCYYMENLGYQQDLCDCPGFNLVSRPRIPLISLLGKAGLS